MECSYINCNLTGTYFVGNNKKQKYCDKHIRFSWMTSRCRKKYNQKLSIYQINDIFNNQFSDNDIICPTCNKKMIWNKKYGENSDVISIQHWEDGSISFICMNCNNRHGHSSNKNILYIDIDNKWCPRCKNIKNKSYFNKCNKKKDKLQSICRKCDNFSNKQRYIINKYIKDL